MSDFVNYHTGGGYNSELEDDKSSVGTPDTEVESIKSKPLQFKVNWYSILFNVKKPAPPAVSKQKLNSIADGEQRRA